MDDPLALDPETMRATGYRMVDLLVERVAGVREWPALTRASRAEMRERLHGPAPEAGTEFDVLLATLERDVLAHMGRVDHPAYFAFIPGSGIVTAAVADLIADVLNRYTSFAFAAPGLVALETSVLRWMVDLFGLPAAAGGILTTGASMAAFSAVVTARAARLPADFLTGTLYVTDQAHVSTAKAAMLAGFNTPPEPLTNAEHAAWIAQYNGICLSSDAFIPFRDNVDRASRSHVQYIAQTGGGLRDADVIAAAEQYGMTMMLTGLRLFLH